jgi:hypothetical protein
MRLLSIIRAGECGFIAGNEGHFIKHCLVNYRAALIGQPVLFLPPER